jgi:hypothetical protein
MNLVEHIDGVVPFPGGVYRKDIKADDVTIHTRIGGARARSRNAPWIWNNRRYVGSCSQCAR